MQLDDGKYVPLGEWVIVHQIPSKRTGHLVKESVIVVPSEMRVPKFMEVQSCSDHHLSFATSYRDVLAFT